MSLSPKFFSKKNRLRPNWSEASAGGAEFPLHRKYAVLVFWLTFAVRKSLQQRMEKSAVIPPGVEPDESVRDEGETHKVARLCENVTIRRKDLVVLGISLKQVRPSLLQTPPRRFQTRKAPRNRQIPIIVGVRFRLYPSTHPWPDGPSQ